MMKQSWPFLTVKILDCGCRWNCIVRIGVVINFIITGTVTICRSGRRHGGVPHPQFTVV